MYPVTKQQIFNAYSLLKSVHGETSIKAFEKILFLYKMEYELDTMDFKCYVFDAIFGIDDQTEAYERAMAGL